MFLHLSLNSFVNCKTNRNFPALLMDSCSPDWSSLTVYSCVSQVVVPLLKLFSEYREDIEFFTTLEFLSCGQADGILTECCHFLNHKWENKLFIKHIFISVVSICNVLGKAWCSRQWGRRAFQLHQMEVQCRTAPAQPESALVSPLSALPVEEGISDNHKAWGLKPSTPTIMYLKDVQ